MNALDGGSGRNGRTRYFVTEGRPVRRRRVSDAIRLAVAATASLFLGALSRRPLLIEESVAQLTAGLPEWFGSLAAWCVAGATAWAVLVVVGAVAGGTRHLDLLRDVAIAVVGAVAASLLAARWTEGRWLAPRELLQVDQSAFPALAVTGLTAVAVVSAPHFTRPVRRVGWTAVGLAAMGSVMVGRGSVGGVLGGITLGITVGEAILVAFGSPRGFPDLPAIADALNRFGLEVTGLSLRDDRSWGQRVVTGHAGGSAVEVKVLGRDAEGAAVLARFSRRLWLRDLGGGSSSSRMRAVEHEALMTKVAGEHGVQVPSVEGFGLAGDDMAVIVLAEPGRPLDDPFVEVGTQVLERLWRQIRVTHEHGLVHGSLDCRSVLLDGDRVLITNWGGSSAFEVQDGQAGRARDVVAALFSTAGMVGAASAVSAARKGLGEDALRDALPWVQTAALPRSTRSASSEPKRLIGELRASLADQLDVELPPPVELRRVTPGRIGMALLLFIAANALVGLLGGIDFAEVRTVVADANPLWLLTALVVGQLVFVPEAAGMLFATGAPLPMWPLTLLQVAVKYIGLAVPSAAGRITMNAAFLHKHGVSTTVATTQGAVDSLAGFLVEAVILVVWFATGGWDVEIDGPDLNWLLILAAVLVVGVVAGVAVTRIRRLRELVLPVLGEAMGLLRSVLTDPRRTTGVLGNNALARLVLALTLWLVLEGIGAPLPFGTVLAITVATNLLAGLVPVPGGIGVAEATMTALLVLSGIGDDTAFAAAVVFRMQTFYLPAVAGFFAMRWLQHHDYL